VSASHALSPASRKALPCTSGGWSSIAGVLVHDPLSTRLCLSSSRRFEAQHVVHTLRREGVRGWVPLLEGVDGTVGLLTTNSSKEVMCVATQQLLADNRLLVSRSLLSVASPPKEVLQQLTAEMRSYMVYVDPPKTLFGKSRRTFTGKMGGHNDDLVIALQLAVLTMQIFTRSEKYRALM